MYNRQSRRKTPKTFSLECLFLKSKKMKKFSTSFVLILFAVVSGNMILNHQKVNASNCHYLETIGGGCPDGNLCHETCRPCYIGIGLILTYCVAPGGGINYWRCRCSFMKGAPCRLPGIACPAPVLSSSSSSSQYLLQDGYGNKTA